MKLAKGISLATGTGALVLALAYLQATAAEPAVGGMDHAAPAASAQTQRPTTTAPRAQTQRRRSYSYQPSSSRARALRNRLPTWERSDSKVIGFYPY